MTNDLESQLKHLIEAHHYLVKKCCKFKIGEEVVDKKGRHYGHVKDIQYRKNGFDIYVEHPCFEEVYREKDLISTDDGMYHGI